MGGILRSGASNCKNGRKRRRISKYWINIPYKGDSKLKEESVGSLYKLEIKMVSKADNF